MSLTLENIIAQTIEETCRDGLKIEPSPKRSKLIDFSEIKKSRRRTKTPSNVNNWKPRDFVSYARQVYRARYNNDWSLSYEGSCLEVQRIQDYYLDVYADFSNKVLYDLIGWFFENYSDQMINKNGEFYFAQLRQDWIADVFLRDYVNSKDTINVKYENNKKPDITKKSLEQAHMLGLERLVKQYGIIVSVNYLHRIENQSPKESAYNVFCVLEKAKKENSLNKIIDATLENGPYPSSLKFTNANLLIKKLGVRKSISIEKTDDKKNQLSFLI